MKRADILNNLLYNSILSPPKTPPPLDTVRHSTDLNEENEHVEPVLLHDITGANQTGNNQPPSLRADCKWHWRHRVKAHGNALRTVCSERLSGTLSAEIGNEKLQKASRVLQRNLFQDESVLSARMLSKIKLEPRAKKVTIFCVCALILWRSRKTLTLSVNK